MLQCSKTLMNFQDGMAAMINGKFFDTADVSKLFGGFTLPGFDFEALMAVQRKNLEAFTQANQLAIEGFQAFAKMQVDLTRTAIDEASALMRDWAETGAPEAKLHKQAEFAKNALAKGVSNTRELVELASKTQTEAFDVLKKRFTESVDEMASFAKKETKSTKVAQRA
jgi:phasin family protein